MSIVVSDAEEVMFQTNGRIFTVMAVDDGFKFTEQTPRLGPKRIRTLPWRVIDKWTVKGNYEALADMDVLRDVIPERKSDG